MIDWLLVSCMLVCLGPHVFVASCLHRTRIMLLCMFCSSPSNSCFDCFGVCQLDVLITPKLSSSLYLCYSNMKIYSIYTLRHFICYAQKYLMIYPYNYQIRLCLRKPLFHPELPNPGKIPELQDAYLFKSRT